jgi:hypothetical protein
MCLLTMMKVQGDDAFRYGDARSPDSSPGETGMSGSLQRLEVLLVGAIMVVAGAVVAALLYLRPPGHQAYSAATAAPVSASAPTASVVPATAEAPVSTSPPPASATATPVVQAGEAIARLVPASLILTAWPLLLVAGGALGLAFVLTRLVRRRRMAYTGQSVAMLLGTADAATRATNLRVMRALHEQGALTADLAAAAGLARRWQWPQRAPFLLPKLTPPAVKRPRLALPTRRPRSVPRLDVPPVSPYTLEAPALPARAAVPAGSSSVEDATQPDTAASRVHSQKRNQGSSAEELALAVEVSLRRVWTCEGLRSTVLAVDTPLAPGTTTVTVTIDVVPDEEERLTALPDLVIAQRPAWRVSWSGGQPHGVLTIENVGHLSLPTSGLPLLAPLLQHGRGQNLMRSLPLDTWPHLGIYGGDALGALHQLLTAVLYSQAPSALALAIVDAGQVSPLYRGVAHQVDAPGDVRTICDVLAGAVRRGLCTDAVVRPLLLVVVEPDAAALAALTALLTRLRLHQRAPVHVILVQERLVSAGRELYALLPALITGGGQGRSSWLPGQYDAWPRQGTARLNAHRMRLEGRAVTRTEAEAAELLAPLRQEVSNLPPVLWDTALGPAHAVVCIQTDTHNDQPQGTGVEVQASSGAEPAEAAASDDAVEPVAPAARSVLLTSGQESRMPGTDLSQTPLAAFLQAAREQASLPPPPPQRPGEAASDTGGTAEPLPAHTSEVVSLNRADETGSAWPAGPPPLGHAALADLMARVVTSPLVTEGAANERGLTKNRVAELLRDLPKAQARDTATVLMAWFDLAGLLAPPDRPGRLRHPRALAISQLEEIAARLAATPIPDATTVAQLWAESLSE